MQTVIVHQSITTAAVASTITTKTVIMSAVAVIIMTKKTNITAAAVTSTITTKTVIMSAVAVITMRTMIMSVVAVITMRMMNTSAVVNNIIMTKKANITAAVASITTNYKNDL